MTIKIATFNVENLFERPEVMNLNTWADGREVLADVARLNDLLARDEYKGATKTAIEKLLDKYEFWNRNKRDRPFEVQQIREKLFKVPKGAKSVELVAKGRNDWVGWVELTKGPIKEEAVVNTGRVIEAVRPDILCTVEVEDRIALQRFNDQVLEGEFKVGFDFNMLVDGNDPRGIDIGLLSRLGIAAVRSHIHDASNGERVFSRDCPEFEIPLPNGKTLWLLGNHFKSKGYGNQKANDAKRERQAQQVAKIYNEARKRSDYVVVAGDLNDFPGSKPMKPLLDGTDLQDVMDHPLYKNKRRKPGTYGSGNTANQKIDYVLLSPALWAKVKDVDVERRGVWAPRSHKPFDEVKDGTTAASDHACVWVDLDVS